MPAPAQHAVHRDVYLISRRRRYRRYDLAATSVVRAIRLFARYIALLQMPMPLFINCY